MPTTDDLQAEIDTLKTQVPTLEGMLFSSKTASWPGGDANSTPISLVPWSYRDTQMCASIPLSILSVGLSFEYWNLAASDTNYWTAQLQVGSGTTWNAVATRTTQSTGANANGGITARTMWSFDASVSPTSMISLAPGQLLAVTWWPTGSPGPQHLPVEYTIRYAEA